MRNRWDDQGYGYRNYGWRNEERGSSYPSRPDGRFGNRGYANDYGDRGYDRGYGYPNRGYDPRQGYDPRYGYGRDQGYGRDDGRWGSDMYDADVDYEWVAIDLEPYGPPQERYPRYRAAQPGIGQRITHEVKKMFRGPKGYKRSDDRIREEVCDRLDHVARHAEVDCGDVEVTVKDGEVILAGSVEERRHKRLLEHVAEEVAGVIDVANQLKVRPGGEVQAEQQMRTGTTMNNTRPQPANGLNR